MTGKELVAYLRESLLDDAEVPYKWSDAELLRFLNFAEGQACRRANLIIDSTTQTDSGTAATASTWGTRALCYVVFEQDKATYSLSTKVIQIRRCQLSSMTYPLKGPMTYDELDELNVGWFGTSGTVGTSGSSGDPWCFLNEPNDTLTFVLAPGTSGTARLVVSRLPLVAFTLSTSPEIHEKYHEQICDWAAHLAFKKPDPDTMNLDLARYYEARFAQNFGPMPDAYSEKMRKTIMMGGRMRAREFGQ